MVASCFSQTVINCICNAAAYWRNHKYFFNLIFVR